MGSPPVRPHLAAEERWNALEAARADARSAEARCRRLEERLSQTIEAAPAAFVAADAGGRILRWSAQAERLLGWTSEEVTGRQLILIPPPASSAEGGDITDLLATDGKRSLPMRMEMPAMHRDGYVIAVELTAWTTEERGTRTYNAFLREVPHGGDHSDGGCRVGSIVESSEAAIIGEGLDGTIVTWNRAAEHLYGYRAGEVLGRPATIIVPTARRQEVRRFTEQAQRGVPVPNHESVRRHKDGSIIDVAVTISPIHDAVGTLTGVSTITRDVGKERRMKLALARAMEEARASEARSQRFLADAAHQLRNPLAGIRACADTLLHGHARAERERLLALVVDQTSHAARLVAGLLRMAGLDRGDLPRPRPHDLVALCGEQAERARVQSPELEVVVRVARLVVPRPSLDPDVVAEIVGNLLDNARRHARRSIELVVDATELQAEVRVVDDGPGLAPELIDRAFERFASLDGKGGSGLGLPIARGLAQAHGGDLTYEEGAFVLRLPNLVEVGDGARSAESLLVAPADSHHGDDSAGEHDAAAGHEPPEPGAGGNG